MRILFMGTPDFAAASLNAMLDAGFDVVGDDKDVLLITSEGVIIRIDTRDISTFGRATKGVRLMRLPENVDISSIALAERSDEEMEE